MGVPASGATGAIRTACEQSCGSPFRSVRGEPQGGVQWDQPPRRPAVADDDRVAGLTSPITYILPDEGWAPLLEIIVREAPARSIIEVNTAGMQALAERMLQEVGRQDVTVALCPPRGMAPAHTAGPANRPSERS
jgi:hypothetical protein